MTSPRYPLGDRLKLFDARVTPSLSEASGTWTMTEEMEEGTADNATTDDEDDHTDEEQINKKVQQPHTARMSTKSPTNHMTQTANRRKTRPRPTNKTPTSDAQTLNHVAFVSHHIKNQDADSSHSFDSAPQDELEDELDPWVDYMVRATHKADDLLAADGITSWIHRQSQK